MEKTKTLCDKLNISYDDSQKWEVLRVDVDLPNKRWHVYLKTTTILTSDYYVEIHEAFKKHYDGIVGAIVVHLVYIDNQLSQIDNNSVIEYYRIFVSRKAEDLSSFNISIEGDMVTFELMSSFDESIVNKYIPNLQLFFKTIGIQKVSFSTNVNVDKQNEVVKKRIEEKKEKLHVISAVEQKSRENFSLFGDDLNKKTSLKVSDVLDPSNLLNKCTIEGVIVSVEVRETKNSHLLIMMVADDTSAISIKAFCGYGNRPPTKFDFETLKKGMLIKVFGKKEFDTYSKEDSIMAEAVTIVKVSVPITQRIDKSQRKRVELHLHTKMSKNNGIGEISEYSQVAKIFGQEAVAITDHNVVQAFVDGEKIHKSTGMKILYGVESTVVGDPIICFNSTKDKLSDTNYVVFDLETTGLSANFNKLIEVGAVKIENGTVVDRYQSFVKIDMPVSDFTTQLTGITDEDLSHGGNLKDVLEEFHKWSKDYTLVAHNAIFDMQFLARNYEKELSMTVTQPVIDTLELSRLLNPERTYHSLKILSKHYGVELDSKSHHRADYDAEKLTDMFFGMLVQIKELEIETLEELNTKNDINKSRGKHDLIYVKNQEGLKDLYKLISDANTCNYQQEPRVYRENLMSNRDNLIIIGGGCSKSRIVDAYLNNSVKGLKKIISEYDYVELLPISQYYDLLNNDSLSNEYQIEQMHKDIYNYATELGIKVVANGNVHYVEPEDYFYKEILYAKDFKAEKVKKNSSGIEEFVDKIKFKKWRKENTEKNKNQYFRSTDEMLEEFVHFDEKIREEIVIDNTIEVSEMISNLKIVPDDLFTPEIPGVDDKLKEMVYEKAYSIYGSTLPKIVEDRIIKEVTSITKYGFSVIYYISHKLVKHSLDNGYLVGSRGSVGSSLVATFMDITEINPLAPHYVCNECQHSEFLLDGKYGSGYDLPKKDCPNCNTSMIRDGQDIPFETFLGFAGDKVPDIDLNFSGEFQAEAHEFVRSKESLSDNELFDFNHAFKAGTIGTIADKTAYAYVRNYLEVCDLEVRRSDISHKLQKLVGIKRTTGQHPGGIIVVPTHRSIYEFTPIQYPADDKKQPWRTTHFDFHSIHDNLLKLDILGHDDPTILKRLFDMTGVNPKHVDITDEKVMQLFSSTESLGVSTEDIQSELGTMGVPEFGTGFVMEMLKSTKPSTFSELVQISGLSHGTDVWIGNAQELIKNKTCELKDVIGCRDDIMVYLMYQGLEPITAFKIMETVRKGKGIDAAGIQAMKDKEVPQWYIDSCLKIQYMFPKAHAAAYVLMALRIAYFKVHYPLEYYAAYFSSRVDDFDAHAMVKGKNALMNRIEVIQEFDTELSEVKKKNILNSLKMSLEMTARGFSFIGFDLYKSLETDFVIDRENKGLILPFSTIDGLGGKEAVKIVQERDLKEFTTKEDFKKRTRVKTKTFEQLEFFEVFGTLVDNNQTKLFDL